LTLTLTASVKEKGWSSKRGDDEIRRHHARARARHRTARAARARGPPNRWEFSGNGPAV